MIAAETVDRWPDWAWALSLSARSRRRALRRRLRLVLADHGRVSLDDLDQTIEDLVEAVTS